VLLVQAVEHREVEHLGVDQFGLSAALGEGADQPLGQADALPV
jgi:hypothetical protein